MQAEFCQRLLATEATFDRMWAVADGLMSGRTAFEDTFKSPELTDKERQRAQSIDVAVPEGVSVLTTERLVPDSRNTLPPCLFVLGDVSCVTRPLVGLVGTRSVSSYGANMAQWFARDLSRAGACVVSGGAIGVDATAHQAVLDDGGTTVCVLPCGVDVVYPSRHRRLFEAVRERGCLVSAYPCSTSQYDYRLLTRNKLIAALSSGLVIVEAPEASGSLTTAHAALAIGRPVFVVPGPAGTSGFRGSHDLIRNGACLVDDPDQVIKALGLNRPAIGQTVAKEGDEAALLACLSPIPLSVEALASGTGLPPEKLLTALTMLELEGSVTKTPEGYALRR